MGELSLSRDERLRLRSVSHHLDPMVLLGAAGLSEAVLKEIDRALTVDELVKVRVPASALQQRDQLLLEVAERLGAARIQLIGRLMVLFRPTLTPDPSPASGRGGSLAARRPDRGTGNILASSRPHSGKRQMPASPRARGEGGSATSPRPGGAAGSATSPRPGGAAGSATSPPPRSGRGVGGEGRKRSQT